MPAFEKMDRKQDALVWNKSSTSSLGQPVVSSTPVALMVRWDDFQSERLDRESNSIAIDATVVVDREIAVGSIMYKGTVSEWGAGSHDDVSGLMLVKLYDETPDIKNRNIRRTVSLCRYSDVLPTS